MNAIVEHVPRAISEPSIVAGATIRSLVPTSFEGVWRMAQMLAASPFSPKDMKSPEACAGAITLGLDLGITPIQAVQSIAVINGRPSIWGDLALALVRASPLCEDVEETLAGEGDKMVATCIAKRKGAKPSTGQFTVDDAKRAQLWNKSGPWQQYPKRMLQLRARAFALRDAFPDVLKGISIREEVEDIQVRDASPPPPPPALDAPAPPAKPEVEDAVIVSETASAGPSPAEAQAADASPDASQVEGASAADHEEPGINPDDEIANLIDKLAYAQDEATVEEWYAETDIEAALAEFTGYVEKARQVKAQQVERVRGIAARAAKAEPQAAAEVETAAPPPPPALADEDDGEAPPPPPAEDAGFDVKGWEALTTQAQYAEYAKLLAAYATKVGDAKIIETFFSDSAKMRSALFPIATAKAERTVIVEGLNAAMTAINAKAGA